MAFAPNYVLKSQHETTIQRALMASFLSLQDLRLTRVHGRFKSTANRIQITILPQADRTKGFLSIKSIFHESLYSLFHKIEEHCRQ
jgi:hypothetical protein